MHLKKCQIRFFAFKNINLYFNTTCNVKFSRNIWLGVASFFYLSSSTRNGVRFFAQHYAKNWRCKLPRVTQPLRVVTHFSRIKVQRENASETRACPLPARGLAQPVSLFTWHVTLRHNRTHDQWWLCCCILFHQEPFHAYFLRLKSRFYINVRRLCSLCLGLLINHT